MTKVISMEETYNLKAIILSRKPFLEDGSRVTVYSHERGKLELVARGAKKIKSKLAGHLEPFCLTDIMAVRGRQYDYVGAAASEQCYFNIKDDLEKLAAAGQAVNVFNRLIKAGEADERLFNLLKDFLCILDSYKLPASPELQRGELAISYELYLHIFIFKLLVELGHKPELYHCVNCQAKITPVSMKFDLARGGLVCGKCSADLKAKEQLTTSENFVKLLRLAEKNDFIKLVKIKIDKIIEKEVKNLIGSFLDHQF